MKMAKFYFFIGPTILLTLLAGLARVDGQIVQLSFPLNSGQFTNPWTAPITSVFDHAASFRFESNGVIVAYTGEIGTIPDPNEPPAISGTQILYSFKKADSSPFVINGYYCGTTTTGSNTLNYDGHPGYDYPVTNGTPVYAAADGVVLTAVPTDSGPSGKYIQIEHTGTVYLSQYLHLSRVDVTNNQSVTRGDLIGLSGNSGGVAAHLHFETKIKVGSDWISVDPYGWQGIGSDPYTNATNLCLWAVGSGQAITNVMSPIVSYQYPDNFSSEVMTNGGIMSPIVSYQYYEWPGNGILNLQSSPTVSYFWQIGNSSGPIDIHGRVTDASGTPLSNATVAAMIYLSPVVQANTDVNGNYQLRPLDTGVYDLSAWDATHQTSMRSLTLNANTTVQNFQLRLMPSAPITVQTNRQPTVFVLPVIGALGETLKIFNGSVFTNISPNNVPSPNLMTIVLTHGWVPEVLGGELANGIDGWPNDMAIVLRANGITTNIANIMAWDWRYAAEGALPPEENTPAEGVLLGQSLQTELGTNYSQPIHFMGHSLGTIVNAAAANYLHGDKTAQQPVSPTPWNWQNTHMTLFDQAEISRIASVQVLFDGLTVNTADPLDVLKYAAQILQGWKPSMPVRSTWADNYISLVGFYLPNTFNIALEKAEGYAGLEFWQAHSYPMVWYSASIANPTDTPLGLQQSCEYDQKAGLPMTTFPSDFYQLGDAYHQTPGNSDPLALEPLPLQNISQLVVPLFGNGADAVVQGVMGTAQVIGNVTATIQSAAQNAAQLVSQGFDYVGGVATQGGQTVVDFLSSAVLHVTLTTAPPTTSGPQVRSNLPQPLESDGNSTSNTPAMVWLPLLIPTNATVMAFDFTVSGDPVDDSLVCGIGTNNLFSLQAKYIPTNTVSASRLIDISQWSGTTNELFFGFLGGTSTNATLQIDNIRFFSLQSPRLTVTQTGNGILFAWPNTAGGYSVQTTTNLATPDWETITNPPVISGDSYILTNYWSDQTRFFRLRSQ